MDVAQASLSMVKLQGNRLSAASTTKSDARRRNPTPITTLRTMVPTTNDAATRLTKEEKTTVQDMEQESTRSLSSGGGRHAPDLKTHNKEDGKEASDNGKSVDDHSNDNIVVLVAKDLELDDDQSAQKGNETKDVDTCNNIAAHDNDNIVEFHKNIEEENDNCPEVGFLLLEDSPVVVMKHDQDEELELERWFDLDIENPLLCTNNTRRATLRRDDDHDGGNHGVGVGVDDEAEDVDMEREMEGEMKMESTSVVCERGCSTCTRCNLVLCWGRSKGHLRLVSRRMEQQDETTPSLSSSSSSSSSPPKETNDAFDGTFHDMKECQGGACRLDHDDDAETREDHGDDQKRDKVNRTRNRSDASLLVGLARSCASCKNLQIRRLTVCFHSTLQERGKKDKEQQAQENVDPMPLSPGPAARKQPVPVTPSPAPKPRALEEEAHVYRATILLTFDMPCLHEAASPAQDGADADNKEPTSVQKDGDFVMLRRSRRTQRGCYQRSARSYDSNSIVIRKQHGLKGGKPLLPAPVQLLLAMAQSEWEQLEERLRESPPRLSLFPTRLSLEQLYLRICGASQKSHVETTRQSKTTTRGAVTFSSSMFCLPKDILCDHVVPFLRMKSIASLRSTCHQLAEDLQTAVPAMKLKLYRHQIKSLLWMRHRESRAMTELNVEEFRLEEDLYRSATAGAKVKLQRRHRNKEGAEEPPWVVDALTGHVLHRGKLTRDSSRQIAKMSKIGRGGLLCDDPGLGKTITILSLILQTFGMTTAPVNKDKDDNNNKPRKKPNGTKNDEKNKSKEDEDEELLQTYWKQHLLEKAKRGALLNILENLLEDSETKYFRKPVDPVALQCPDYYDVIKNPICLHEIAKKLRHGSDYLEDFYALQEDVQLCFRNAMDYNPEGDIVHDAAERLLALFYRLQKKERTQIIIAAENFSSGVSTFGVNPSSVGSAVDLREKAKMDFIRALHPSPGTLLVVPNTLLGHWEEQIRLHVDFAWCTEKVPLTFRYKRGRNSQVAMADAISKVQVQKTHLPVLLIDEGTHNDMPPADFLAMFHIVITSIERLSAETKHGSFEDEIVLKKKRARLRDEAVKDEDEDYNDSTDDHNQEVGSESSSCPLLQIYWLRLIVDEGHKMGRGEQTNAVLFASWITAQRRWAMTGTPTPQVATSNGLRNVFGLVRFLQHSCFDASWNDVLSRQWNQGQLAPFYRLQSLLSLLMVRHTKDNIMELAPPLFKRTLIEMSTNEIQSYNTLVSGVQANITLTSLEGKTSGWQDSLLNPRQLQSAQEALGNIRLACCGNTDITPTLSYKNRVETNHLLQDIHKLDDTRKKVVTDFLNRAPRRELSSCMRCGVQLQTLLIMPCGDLVCTECIHKDTKACPVCNEAFDVDDFQRLQPGFKYEWQWNLKADPDLDMPPVFLLEPRTHRRGRSQCQCVYTAQSKGFCTECVREHRDCNFMNPEGRCPTCFRESTPIPEKDSKSNYLLSKLLELRKREAQHQKESETGRLSLDTLRSLKVIVFSQFRKILDSVGDRLLRRLGHACVAEYWGQERDAELLKFAKSEDCFCMLLGQTGTLGLDLSFVTHIIFLDEIMDKSEKDQIVARAYRMGAKGSVEVEQLVSRDSVEELMVALTTDERGAVTKQGIGSGGQKRKSLTGKGKQENQAKVHFLLKNLRIIRPDGATKLLSSPSLKSLSASSGTSIGKTSDNEHDATSRLANKRVRLEHDEVADSEPTTTTTNESRKRVRFDDDAIEADDDETMSATTESLVVWDNDVPARASRRVDLKPI